MVITADENEPELPADVERQRTVTIVSWIICFFLAIWLLGFTYAAVIATFLYLKVGTRETWPQSLALSLVSWLLFYGLFDHLLHLPFPVGAVFEWF